MTHNLKSVNKQVLIDIESGVLYDIRSSLWHNKEWLVDGNTIAKQPWFSQALCDSMKD